MASPTRTPIRPRPRRALAFVLAGWFVLGLVPRPAAGVPSTEFASVRLDPAELASPGIARADGAAIRLSAEKWTRADQVCAPFAFTMAAVTWQGADEAEAALGWGEGATRAEGEGHEGPDPGSEEWNDVEGTPLVWTGEQRCLTLKLRTHEASTLRRPRVVFINSSGTGDEQSPLAAAGAWIARGVSSVLGWMHAAPAEAWTKQPGIILRPQWGANESLRSVNCDGTPDYADAVRVAYIHHTASGNGYSKGGADDAIRGIYAYHVKSRGYCDIAYNFLIDKWGRTYEGRFGGITEPVIGGHAMGFNTRSTGIAALGTFSSKRPSDAMIRAFKRLIRWRLDVAHRKPNGFQWMTSAGGSNQKFDRGENVYLRSVIAHRRTGYTDCPGDRLARFIRKIRRSATRRGHPKIYDPVQSSSDLVHGDGQVSWRARVSRSDARWRIDIVNSSSSVVRSFTGTGTSIAGIWDGTTSGGVPVPDGDYTVNISASRGSTPARPADFTLRVCALAEPGESTCPDPDV